MTGEQLKSHDLRFFTCYNISYNQLALKAFIRFN